MLTIAQVARHLERLAPLPYQESYDNAGLLTGDPQAQVTGILLTLDATEAVVDEALAKGCNLVVAHHPIVFSGLKKLTGRTYVERVLIRAIRDNVALYAIHTNLDNVLAGVNAQICRQLGLVQPRILAPKRNMLKKLTVFVPIDHSGALLDALAGAGAGQIGNYSHCSFTVAGQGTFRPNAQANPYLGQAGELERVAENRIEVVFPGHLEGAVLAAMRQAHPYEEVAYYVHLLENANQDVGAGMVGELPGPLPERDFLQLLKDRFALQVVRHTPLLGREVRRVAVCGGAGSFLLPQAIGAKADFFVTADYKYHQFFDADGQIVIADIGHYESEVGTKELLRDQLQAHLPAGLLHLSGISTNPVRYFF
jgi:dinuclear metal center YbgI/SA1388 family protein